MFDDNKKKIFKNPFKEVLRYIFSIVMLFNTVFYLKLSFKLEIDPKTCNFKKMEDILKTWGKFAKNVWQPCI